jgi:NitT/TauT family transport system ATP-binding protein
MSSTDIAHGLSGSVNASDVFTCEKVAIAFDGPQGRHTVLSDVAFGAKKGEFISLVGGSGTGKTTLLRILSGLADPEPGSVVNYHGKPVTGPPEGAVFVFQDYRGSLLPWRTVEHNIELGLERSKMSRSERRAKARNALELVGLGSRGKDYPWRLSGGMQQRVQIARALAMEPEVLLMDEPFGALDAMTKATLQDELHRLHHVTGTTILFVTHDIEEAVYLSDRVIVLSGSPARITADIPIALPQERTQLETRASEEFLEMRQLVHNAIGHH